MMLLEDGCCEAPGDRRLPVTFQKRQVCNQRQDSGGWGGVGGSGCYQSGWAVLATGEAEEASIPSLPLCLLSTLALAHSFIQKTLSSDGPDNQDTLRRRGVGYMEVSMTWYHPLKGWLVGAYVCTYVCTHKLTHLHTGCRELSSRNLDVLKPPALKMGLNAFTECMDEWMNEYIKE